MSSYAMVGRVPSVLFEDNCTCYAGPVVWGSERLPGHLGIFKYFLSCFFFLLFLPFGGYVGLTVVLDSYLLFMEQLQHVFNNVCVHIGPRLSSSLSFRQAVQSRMERIEIS